jgi:chromosome partitioning protein
MKIIVFAATKGGTGKTTLAFNAGLEAARHGTVFLADMDPQRSLAGLCETRGRHLDSPGDNPLLLEEVQSIGGAAAQLARAGYSRDYLIADTPGSFMRVIEEAITAADCVVLPVQASPLDVLAQEDIARLVNKRGKETQALFVLNRCDARVNQDDTVRRLGLVLACPIVRVNQRHDYARSLIAGQTGAEVNKACAGEVASLWAAIEAILQKDKSDEKAQHGGCPARTGT